MTFITLRDCPNVHEQIPKFTAILAAYGINVVDCIYNNEDKTVNITTDAYQLVDVRSVSAVAYDCFEDAMIGYRTIL